MVVIDGAAKKKKRKVMNYNASVSQLLAQRERDRSKETQQQQQVRESTSESSPQSVDQNRTNKISIIPIFIILQPLLIPLVVWFDFSGVYVKFYQTSKRTQNISSEEYFAIMTTTMLHF